MKFCMVVVEEQAATAPLRQRVLGRLAMEELDRVFLCSTPRCRDQHGQTLAFYLQRAIDVANHLRYPGPIG